ncbi:MAG: ROK family protein, partial [Planctomycetes bacterium]|nr:ROK family protein [Planctomycetota bacterium]
MSTFPDNVLLVGVDGGASEVKAHQVLVLAEEGALELAAGPAMASTCYERIAGFEPASVAQQLVAFQRKQVVPSDIEALQGEMWVEAAAGAILSVAAQAGERDVVIGMCMPGLKTADGRGIGVLRNGPRMPDFCAQLERELATEGLRLARPIQTLASDGEACAWGEECDAQGLLRGVGNAYYLGGGTGLAEALKLRGEILGLDAVKQTLPKAWQMESKAGAVFEEWLSMRAINERFAARAGIGAPLSSEDLPEVRAAAGDEEAIRVFTEAADALVELCMLRIHALHAGKKPGAR